MGEHKPKPGKHQHELETLRTLLNLPRDVLDKFSPREPPEHVTRYIKGAPKPELQWALVDVLHQLRLRSHDEHQRHEGNGRW